MNTAIMEALAKRGLVDEFLEAVDSDNFSRMRTLLRMPGVNDAVSVVEASG